MKCLIYINILLPCLVISGCAFQYASDEPNKRCNMIVDSIPSQADIYGISRVDGTLTHKLGTTPCEIPITLFPAKRLIDTDPIYAPMDVDWISWAEVRRDGQLDGEYYANFAFIKDGYREKRLRKTLFNVKGAWNPPDSIGVTVHLEPGYEISQEFDRDYKTSFGERTHRQSDYYKEAKAEYEQALAAYNQALKELNEARTLAAAPKKYPHPALGALMAIAEPHSVAEAERKVEIARQRLERAKARIDHSEW